MDLETQQGINQNTQRFQQDEATQQHTISKFHLDQRFSDRLISWRHDAEWSPNSKVLSPPDFYLRGLLKDGVYQNNSKTIAKLKMAITLNLMK